MAACEHAENNIELCMIKLWPPGLAYHWALRVRDEIYQVDIMGGMFIPMEVCHGPADSDTMDGWIGLLPLGTTHMPRDQIRQFAEAWKQKHPRYIFFPRPNCQDFVADLYKELTGNAFPYQKDSRAPLTVALGVLVGAVLGMLVGLFCSRNAWCCAWSAIIGSVAGSAMGLGAAIVCRNVPMNARSCKWQVGCDDPILRTPRSTITNVALGTADGVCIQVTPRLRIQTSNQQEERDSCFQLVEREEKGRQVCYLKSIHGAFLGVRGNGTVTGGAEKAAGWERFVLESCGDYFLLKSWNDLYLSVPRAVGCRSAAVTTVKQREEATGFTLHQVPDVSSTELLQDSQ